MARLLAITFLLAAAVISTAREADAQLFGNRELGGFLGRRNSPGALSNPAEELVNPGGALTGEERYIRGNRRATDFIGTDTGDDRPFIGAVQARQRAMQPAAAEARERRRPNVNRPLPPESNSPNSPYPPRMELAPDLRGPNAGAVAAGVERHLLKSRIQWVEPLEVVTEGRTTVLRGTVTSARDRALAATLTRFEPGVGDVRNDLRVVDRQQELPAADDSPAALGPELADPNASPPSSPSPREF
ncbi:MAG: BON domain-containing protein [Planctomycetota bacterium]|nr:MAG: BON domain-containing protein [Planctomycetota bacterium]